MYEEHEKSKKYTGPVGPNPWGKIAEDYSGTKRAQNDFQDDLKILGTSRTVIKNNVIVLFISTMLKMLLKRSSIWAFSELSQNIQQTNCLLLTNCFTKVTFPFAMLTI